MVYTPASPADASSPLTEVDEGEDETGNATGEETGDDSAPSTASRQPSPSPSFIQHPHSFPHMSVTKEHRVTFAKSPDRPRRNLPRRAKAVSVEQGGDDEDSDQMQQLESTLQSTSIDNGANQHDTRNSRRMRTSTTPPTAPIPAKFKQVLEGQLRAEVVKKPNITMMPVEPVSASRTFSISSNQLFADQ